MRTLMPTLLLLLVAGTLPAQSLVQLAQKEKERRRSLKGKQPVEASKYGERRTRAPRWTRAGSNALICGTFRAGQA